MNKKVFVVVLLVSCLVVLGSTLAVAAKAPSDPPTAELLVDGLEGTMGSTVGPDGALYVPEYLAGRISRIDPQTGAVSTFADGLPLSVFPDLGGVVDVVFMGHTAYALTSLIAADVGGSEVVGIYRIEPPSSYTVIADLGQWSMDNPPEPAFFIPTGVPFALDTFRGDFLVTDGHHNRVLRVTLDGDISELATFDNVVPTGLDKKGNKVYMSQIGPNPHNAVDGKVLTIMGNSGVSKEIASGATMPVDVELMRGNQLYALSQGTWDGAGEGSPALPDTGALYRVKANGSLALVTDGLDRPNSLEFIKDTAYIVNLVGEVWMIEDVTP